MRASLLAAAVVAATSLGAVSVDAATFKASSAIGSGADHSIWLSNGVSDSLTNKDFDFMPDGILELDANYNGTLTGTVKSQDATVDGGFTVLFNFASAVGMSPAAKFKSENSSVLSSIDGFLANMTGGTLTGFGDLLGLNIDVSLMRGKNDEYAVQVGSGENGNNGANNKNTNFGMAFWFTSNATSTNCAVCDSSTAGRLTNVQGDVNIDLAPVPVPAGAFLTLTGLGAIASIRRRRRA